MDTSVCSQRIVKMILFGMEAHIPHFFSSTCNGSITLVPLLSVIKLTKLTIAMQHLTIMLFLFLTEIIPDLSFNLPKTLSLYQKVQNLVNSFSSSDFCDLVKSMSKNFTQPFVPFFPNDNSNSSSLLKKDNLKFLHIFISLTPDYRQFYPNNINAKKLRVIKKLSVI